MGGDRPQLQPIAQLKAEFPDYSTTEVTKELGRRWTNIDPVLEQSYEQRSQDSRRQYERPKGAYLPQEELQGDEQRYQDSRRQHERPKGACWPQEDLEKHISDSRRQHERPKGACLPQEELEKNISTSSSDVAAMAAYKPTPSAYFIFSSEERLKVMDEHPNYSICEIDKELGQRWADMAPEVKQRYQKIAGQLESLMGSGGDEDDEATLVAEEEERQQQQELLREVDVLKKYMAGLWGRASTAQSNEESYV